MHDDDFAYVRYITGHWEPPEPSKPELRDPHRKSFWAPYVNARMGIASVAIGLTIGTPALKEACERASYPSDQGCERMTELPEGLAKVFGSTATQGAANITAQQTLVIAASGASTAGADTVLPGLFELS